MNAPMNRSGQRGVAIVTAIWMLLIGVMLVTTIASVLTSTVLVGAAGQYKAHARLASISGIQATIADLLNDRPSNIGLNVVITEVKNDSYLPAIVNFVQDPGFEVTNNSDTWEVYSSSTSNRVDSANVGGKRSGSYGVRFNSLTTTATDRRIYSKTRFKVFGGLTYSFGGWAYTNVDPTLTQINLTLTWYNAAGATTGSPTTITSVFTNATTWEEFKQTGIVAPADAVTAAISVAAAKLTGAGTVNVFLDDVYLSAPASEAMKRRYEYIEIQNLSTNSADLVSSHYKISAGSATCGNPRYLYPLFSGSNTLNPKEVALVVPVDFDSTQLHNTYGVDTAAIKWFGLKATAAATSFDQYLGAGGAQTLSNGEEYLDIMLDTEVTAGIHFTNIGAITTDQSYKKLYITPPDETGPVGGSYTDSALNCWERRAPLPGKGILQSSGRPGVDGYGDAWYDRNYESYDTFYTSGNMDVFYRVKIYDEGAKLNVNHIAAMGVNPSDGEDSIFSAFLRERLDPPFSKDSYTISASIEIMRGLTYLGDSTRTGITPFVTPGSIYYIFAQYAAGGAKYLTPMRLPYLSVYGYHEYPSNEEFKNFAVNVNMAESSVLRAVLSICLARGRGANDWHYASATDLTSARLKARLFADRIVNYLTGGDAILSNDKRFSSLALLGDAGTAEDKAAVVASLASTDTTTNLSYYLDVASNNYFTLYSTGYVYQHGAAPGSDTPISQCRTIAVVRRDQATSTADILYWREVFETADTTMQVAPMIIGSWRYPRLPWGPAVP